MKATANVVNAGQTVHPREGKSSATKAVTAPKPTLLSAKPAPGNHTAAITLLNAGRPRAVGATRRSRATSSNAASGPSVVASAIAVKTSLPYKIAAACGTAAQPGAGTRRHA